MSAQKPAGVFVGMVAGCVAAARLSDLLFKGSREFICGGIEREGRRRPRNSLHSVGPDSQHSGTTVQHQVPQQGCLSATAGHAIFEVARSGGTGRRSRLKICRSFALCGCDSLLRDHPSCNSLILLLRRSIILGAAFTLWTFLGVDQGLAVWRPRARDGILVLVGWHDVTLLVAARLSG